MSLSAGIVVASMDKPLGSTGTDRSIDVAPNRRSQSPGEQQQQQVEHHDAAWIQALVHQGSNELGRQLPLPCRLPHHLRPQPDGLLMEQNHGQRTKGGAQDHGEGAAVQHDIAHAAGPAMQQKGLSVPPPPPPYENADEFVVRRASPNTSSSGDDTFSSSGWLRQALAPPPRQYCVNGNGSDGAIRRMMTRPPPPSLEMSLGRQGWQMEQCGGGVEFESSPSAKERTLLKCL